MDSIYFIITIPRNFTCILPHPLLTAIADKPMVLIVTQLGKELFANHSSTMFCFPLISLFISLSFFRFYICLLSALALVLHFLARFFGPSKGDADPFNVRFALPIIVTMISSKLLVMYCLFTPQQVLLFLYCWFTTYQCIFEHF